jgi:hypothetical protein
MHQNLGGLLAVRGPVFPAAIALDLFGVPAHVEHQLAWPRGIVVSHFLEHESVQRLSCRGIDPFAPELLIAPRCDATRARVENQRVARVLDDCVLAPLLRAQLHQA